MTLKIGSHSFHLSLTILALAAGALFVYSRSGNAGPLDAWLASSRAEVATAKAWKDRTAQLATASTHERAAAAFYRDSMGTLEGVFDSLVAQAQRPGQPTVTLAQIGQACHDALEACKKRGDALAAADSLDREQALANLLRAQHADSLLSVGVKVADCRVLFLKCPSRTQAFEAGTGLGALLILILHSLKL